LRAVTVDPEVVWVAFQIWLICWPFGKVQTTVQPSMAAVEVLVNVTSAWKPPPHCPTIE